MDQKLGSAWINYGHEGQDVRQVLDKSEMSLGRSSDCDVCLPFSAVSRRHCQLRYENDGWIVSDLGSRNGTYVNGAKTTGKRLQHGDCIHFGPPTGSEEIRIVFHDRDAERLPASVFRQDEADPPEFYETINIREFTNSLLDHASTPKALISLFHQMGQALLMSDSLDDMLRRVLDLAFDNLPAEQGSICMYDATDDVITSKCSRNGIDRLPIEISQTVANAIIQRQEAVLVTNAIEDTRFGIAPSLRCTSVIAAPMYHEGDVLGLIYLEKGDVQPFRRDQLDLLSAISVFSAAGVRNAQLHDEYRLEQRRRALATSQIHVLLEIAKSLSSELETNTLIKLIMQRARDLVDAERCTLFLLDRESAELYSKVADETPEIRFPMDRGLAGCSVTNGTLLNVDDVYDDPRFNPEIDQNTGFVTRNLLCIPLRNINNEITGVMQILNKKSGTFTDEDESLMEACSAQAAIAIENAQLFQRTVDLNNYLQSVLQSITNMVLTLDHNGRLITANHDVHSFLGKSEEMMRDRHYAEWFDGENAGLVNDIRRVYGHPDSIYVAEYDLQVGDAAISANYTIVPLLDFEQSQTGVVVVLDDISKQKRMMNTLGRYMSPALAQQVLKEDEARLGGVRQQAAILFADIRGYTTLAETLDATEIVELLNDYFSVMVDVILTEGGILDKFIGDALMAVFGVPFPAEDDSERACRAALKMRMALAEFNRHRVSKNLQPIRFGIGINSGIIVSGSIGSERRAEYTSIGDGVNLASRLEGVTKKYGATTILSEFTHNQLGKEFTTRELDLVRVTGRVQPVRIYELLDPNDQSLSAFIARGKSHFAAGLHGYRQKNWDEAEREFAAAWDIANDPPSRAFIERCQFLRRNPPPEDWDGVWDVQTK